MFWETVGGTIVGGMALSLISVPFYIAYRYPEKFMAFHQMAMLGLLALSIGALGYIVGFMAGRDAAELMWLRDFPAVSGENFTRLAPDLWLVAICALVFGLYVAGLAWMIRAGFTHKK